MHCTLAYSRFHLVVVFSPNDIGLFIRDNVRIFALTLKLIDYPIVLWAVHRLSAIASFVVHVMNH